MRKVALSLLLLVTSCFALAQDFVAGEHYQQLNTNVSNEKTVTEFFSYFCPHCYNFEPIAQNLKTSLPADVRFERVPVSFIGGAMGPELQKAHATAVILGIEDKIAPALFNAIHVQRTPPANRAAVKQLFIAQGISPQVFDSHIDSMPVLSAVAGYDRHLEQLNIRSVPSFVVNNRYLINISSLKSEQQFQQLVHYLLQKAAV